MDNQDSTAARRQLLEGLPVVERRLALNGINTAVLEGGGGAVAAPFAAESRARLRALVLVDTLGLTAFQPAPEFGAALDGFLTTPNARSHDRL